MEIELRGRNQLFSDRLFFNFPAASELINEMISPIELRRSAEQYKIVKKA